ncbi:DNA polymerase III subunit delta' [Saccharibacillus sp. CPCC 101409]|uniref:DNA polymerase III subunit delta' n=1 Tax=Saccharibacillus sp. CPCC 101409 TaxID=3058041 RepID=UPI0026740DBA|nr:DNA polymerase III subunit delta' [Saccharibacillus sp. CPCC 101409]MDO3412923.1 DNA polymerase III subunit delta' [Saccharibacillus sp. CPCC 101409]
MSLQTISGQATAKRMLGASLRSGRVSHAYLFSGPGGSSRRKVAEAFAKALLCERGAELGDACGECLSCRKVEHGNHPDLQTVVPGGASIKIEQIRELQKMFSYRSGSAGRKVYIIDEAEKMTVQASNSLLKFLEEPPAPAVAILLSENGQALLPTIRSRTQLVPFTSMGAEDILSELAAEGLATPAARCAAYLTPGPDECRELAAENWFAEIRNVVIQLGKESIGRSGASLVTAQQKVFKGGLGEHLESLFDLFHLWFRDMIHVQSERREHIVFIDQMEFISQVAGSRSTEYWIACMSMTAESKKKLKSNMNTQLCLEQFLVELVPLAGSI